MERPEPPRPRAEFLTTRWSVVLAAGRAPPEQRQLALEEMQGEVETVESKLPEALNS